MQQELDAVNVFEDRTTGRSVDLRSPNLVDDFARPAFLVKPRQCRHLLAIHLWRGESQLFLKCLFEHADVSVFAKYQRHNQPIISGAHLPVSAVISEERPLPPPSDVGWGPLIGAGLLPKWRGVML